MKESDFGKTEIAPGIFISKLAFGTAPIGNLFTVVDQDEGIATIRHAMARGVKYFDSALYYGGGKALEALGAALGEPPPPDVVISFKVGRIMVDGPGDPNVQGRAIHLIDGYAGAEKQQYVFDYSAGGVEKAFAQSMAALNKGRADKGLKPLDPAKLNIVIYAHDPEVGVHKERYPLVMSELLTSGFPKLYDMQQKGRIKAYGIGTNEIKPCIDALKDEHIGLMLLAGRGTLLCNGTPSSQGPLYEDGKALPELLTKMKAHANKPKLVVAAIGNSGLGYGSGIYNYARAGETTLKFRDDVFAAMKDYNQETGAAINNNNLLVHYPLDFLGEQVAAIMPGPRSIKEFEDTAVGYEQKVPKALWDDLMQRTLLNPGIQQGGAVEAPAPGVQRAKKA